MPFIAAKDFLVCGQAEGRPLSGRYQKRCRPWLSCKPIITTPSGSRVGCTRVRPSGSGNGSCICGNFCSPRSGFSWSAGESDRRGATSRHGGPWLSTRGSGARWRNYPIASCGTSASPVMRSNSCYGSPLGAGAHPDLVESGCALDSSSENRSPPRIKSGAGFFRDLLWRAAASLGTGRLSTAPPSSDCAKKLGYNCAHTTIRRLRLRRA